MEPQVLVLITSRMEYSASSRVPSGQPFLSPS